jgi:two-component system chemotaxis sensor kinase CheA
MSRKDEKYAHDIRSVLERIDELNLSDPDPWRDIGGRLQKIAEGFPKKHAELSELLVLCGDRLQLLSDGKHPDALTSLDGVSEALEAIETSLVSVDKDEERLKNCRRRLSSMTQTAGPAPGSPAEAPPSFETLNDAAAYLMQIEAGQPDALGHLAGKLGEIAEAKDCPGACREKLGAVCRKIDACIAAAGGKDSRDLAEIGALLEEAMLAQAETVDRADDAPPADRMPRDPDPDLLAEFVAESGELIAAAEEALLLLETEPGNVDAIGKVFRAFHTVKGTSAFLELDLIAELGHHAENLLSRVRDGEIRYGGGYADLCLKALDMIKELVSGVREAVGGAKPFLKPEAYDELMAALADPDGFGITEDADDIAAARLGDLMVARGHIDREQAEAAMQSFPGDKSGMALVKSKAASVTEVGRALRTQQLLQGGGQAVDASVRVSTQRLDRLVDMVGELVIAHSMVSQDEVVCEGENHELAKKVAHTSKIVRELQDISMSMRMVPLKATFNKMARLVRDVSRKAGKTVQFATEGEDTEIDRNLVDIINDPLVHMVRNAVDHGIEPPAERKKNGKSETGRIKLCAYHSAGNVVVEIQDDGQGLDRGAILKKAAAAGLLEGTADAEGNAFSDRDVFNLIFEPGFSTVEQVTELSGRGVGMDVVKKNIEKLRGQVEIKSEPGKGCLFKMSLPLTLAIIDGMVIRVAGETCVIPTVSIIRSVKPSPSDLSTVLRKGEMLSLHDRLVPLYPLSRLYRRPEAPSGSGRGIIVVVEDEERQAGLVVDELVGRQQVVIKSLGETMRRIPGVSGGAIMPDGRVGLILDVCDLVRLATKASGEEAIGACDSGRSRPVAA